jgi:amino acid adenylation domain-containing protein/thioester reductase-like protein
VRYRPDGNIDYLGRIDHQVKIRGFRIELGEIEAQLLLQPDIKEAVVIAREDQLGDKRLVAYLVEEQLGTLQVDELKAQLKQALPDYMVPSAFVVLEQMPLSTNGKLDRKKLPAPDMTEQLKKIFVAPRTETEQALTEIWQEVLGLEIVGIEDDFFELGGYSLLATQLLSRIANRLNIKLPLRSVFEASNITALAERIESVKHEYADGMIDISKSIINVNVRNTPIPLSFAQQRLWFLDQLEPGSSFYNIPIALRLTGHLDLTALTQSFNEIVRRHEILRTVFEMGDVGEPVQKILPSLIVNIEPIDLTATNQTTVWQAFCRDEVTKPFDLCQGPLIRVSLLMLADNSGYQDAVLMLTMHHIVSDGWSLKILVKEFAALYSAFVQNQPSPLPELPIQYADFACWQRRWLVGGELERQLNYWREQLGNTSSFLELPTDHPRPSVMTYCGATQCFDIEPDLAQQIRVSSKQHNVTLFIMLLAVFKLLLSRYSGQSDICVGTPVANRNRQDIENLIGFFVNTLVLRSDLSANPNFAELLVQVKSMVLDAQNHQDLPFEKLVEALQPERDPSRTPLFQVMFVLQNHDKLSLSLPGVDVAVIEDTSQTAKFDLTLHIQDWPDGRLSGAVEYNTDLFEAETIKRFTQHYLILMKVAIKQPQARVSELPLLSTTEERQILHDWNATDVEYPQNRCIHQLFEAQVEQTPDAIALTFEGKSLSYTELNAQANQLAHYLIERGVGPDVLVGICLERSLEMVIGLLGILKAGGAYVPLDPNYPEERLMFMLADIKPIVVLTQAQFSGRDLGASEVLSLDSNWSKIESYPNVNPCPDLQPTNLAYCIYTSGSTGQPKGAGVPHQGILNRLQWMQAEYRLHHTDQVLQKTPYSFDVSVWEFFWSLMTGARLVVAAPELHKDSQGLIELIRRERITTIHFVPSMLQAFVDTPDVEHCTSLKRVICSGEALPADLVQRFQQKLPAELHNLYGPTEASVDVSYWACPPNCTETAVPIGKPIANIQLHILDRSLNPVPVGTPGELHIAGIGLGRGYLNRPGLTAEKFIPDPFGPAGSRLYKTGDLVRYRSDGNIDYLGRIDHQVKIRGFRIELGEIEAQLLKHEGVKEAVVLAREDQPGDKRLVAYLVEEQLGTLQVDELKAQLKHNLPDYMVPSAFVVLDEMPLSANGKLDRKKLPTPEWNWLSVREYEAPQGEVETVLAEVWQQLLGIERVSRHDHFFELGGHSLLVITMVQRLREHGWSADARTVFVVPVLADMAAAIAGSSASDGNFAIPPNLLEIEQFNTQQKFPLKITPEKLPLADLSQTDIDSIVAAVPGGASNIQDIYPLSPLQEGILFHHVLDTQGDTYLLRSVLAFENRDYLERFIAALQQVINRHDILRSAVFWQDLPQPLQAVFREATLPVHELASQEGDALAELLETTDPHRLRLDLRRAPLLAAYSMADQQNGEWLLALLSHHIVSDHISLEFVIAEIRSLFQGRMDELPPSIPYRNFIAQLRRYSPEKDEIYFRRQLSDVTEPTAPFGLLDVKNSGEIIEERFTLPIYLAQKIREQAKKQGVSPAALFHVAWAQVLAQCCGQDDVVFGTVLTGRMTGYAGVERTIGMFINTLPIRIKVGGISVEQAVVEAHKNLTELLAHEQTSLTLALRCSAVGKAMPLFTTILNYRHIQNSELSPSEEDVEGLRTIIGGEERSNYPITFSVDDFGDLFGFTVQCVNGISPAKFIGWVCSTIEKLVAALIGVSNKQLKTISILPEKEYQQLIFDWNPRCTGYPENCIIHQSFEAQAIRTPDAIAVTFEEHNLSYAELNAKANQLANYLITQGVAPDVLVGICLERSLEMIIGLLGVLKAGGAYVPLDPTYPEQRLAMMLANANAGFLLSRAGLLEKLEICHPDRKKPAEEITAYPIQTICLDNDWPAIAKCSTANPITRVHPLNLAYLIYTSGSTGQPKGVAVNHRNAAYSTWARFKYYLEPVRGYLLLSSFAFDSSVAGIFWVLGQGGYLCIPSEAVGRDPMMLAALIDNKQVSHLLALPSLYLILMDQVPAQLRSLKVAIVAGEACSTDVVKRHYEILPGVKLYNEYGPTEGTVWSSAYQASLDDIERPLAIGRPIDHVRIYILDQNLNPVPAGVAGELYIGGAGIVRGYWRLPELSAERFIPDPFQADGGRLYKTGDLVRYRGDSAIEFLGRIDHQVKIRGFRIELGEIEAQLLKHPDIKEAVVVALEGQAGDKRLAAYLVAKQLGVLQDDELKTQLKQILPDFMVPATFVVLEQMPLSANGKLDRKKLPAPDISGQFNKPYIAPRTKIESILATVWKQILTIEQVGVEDDFFYLGGHSLLAAQLAFAIEKALQTKFPVKVVFENPSIAQQARWLTGDANADEIVDLNAEAQLGSDIWPIQTNPIDITQSRALLLTGATGFLGGFLLVDLLEQTHANVYCLIRAANESMALNRLQQQMRRYELFERIDWQRVIPVCGDLATEHLGLTENRYREIATNADAIFHNGALVNFVQTYQSLKATNVLSGIEVLRLAATARSKAIHYVSTLSVFAGRPTNPQGFTETDVPLLNDELTGGYAHSKWVAEKVFRSAQQRGFQIKIYRPATVAGDSLNGVWNQDDFMCRILKGCIQMGLAPDVDSHLDLAPVDDISRAIVTLAQLPHAADSIYHLNHPNPPTADFVFDWFIANGFPLRKVSSGEWRTAIQAAAQTITDFALAPMQSLFVDEAISGDQTAQEEFIRYDCSVTQSTLARQGVTYRPIDNLLLTRYQDYFVRSRFIDAVKLEKFQN